MQCQEATSVCHKGRNGSANRRRTAEARTGPAPLIRVAGILAAAASAVVGLTGASFGAPLPASYDWSAADGGAQTNFAYEVSTAGDVNGDGYSDVLVACPGYEGDLGGAFVYCGGPSGLSPSACWLAEGTIPGRQFAIHASAAGDVNGDGYHDVIVGAWGYEDGEFLEGGAFVYHGSASGLSASPDWQVEGNIPEMYYGSVVANAGDVNADGYDDVLVGTHWHDGGVVRCYLGSASGLSTSWDWDYSPAYGSFGYDIASAGDINADGYDDVIVGAPGYGSGGRAYLFFGSASGLSVSPDWTADGPSSSSFGSGVAGAGDVDGDGFGDIAVGWPNYSGTFSNEGAIAVYFGSASGPSSSPDWTTTGGQSDARMLSVGPAGDINGDGYDDLLTGTEFYTNTFPTEGRVRCFYGSPSGPPATADWTRFGEQSGAWLGSTVTNAGDINRDGYSDIVIGARNYDDTYNNEGAVFIYTGGPGGLSSSIWFSGGQEDSWFGFSADTGGDLNGDGFADVIVGDERFDETYMNAGAMYVYLGNDETPAGGLDIRPRQKTTQGDPIPLMGRSDAPDRFILALQGRSPKGRDRVRAEWQIAETGMALQSVPIQSGVWHDTGAPSGDAGSVADVEEELTGLTGETLYHWRVRTRTRSLYTPFTRWVSIAPAARSMAHLRTGGAPSDVAGHGEMGSVMGIREIAPNPMVDHATVSFQISSSGPVRLTVHDVTGRQVATVVDRAMKAGTHRERWDGAAGSGTSVAS
ncbi:MAG: hypothetical protein GF355_13035 [Candidatus Eisenbacteria bacterium]|nr:hypothetical protein [Candidatus Eisenbacteria bacterium]